MGGLKVCVAFLLIAAVTASLRNVVEYEMDNLDNRSARTKVGAEARLWRFILSRFIRKPKCGFQPGPIPTDMCSYRRRLLI